MKKEFDMSDLVENLASDTGVETEKNRVSKTRRQSSEKKKMEHVCTLVDIEQMAKLLPKDASWQFAQFMNKNCLDPDYNDIYPYTDEEANEIVDYAKLLISGSNLR